MLLTLDALSLSYFLLFRPPIADMAQLLIDCVFCGRGLDSSGYCQSHRDQGPQFGFDCFRCHQIILGTDTDRILMCRTPGCYKAYQNPNYVPRGHVDEFEGEFKALVRL